ncbi:hypothetical protein MNAN1_000153 [Malassezia nana]|uniref:EF-hand domain-containing protein n=1 Tax=Malassezia nana TaxID=180528 RepID=A0AAF0EN70_9BASI|nr:hypothetical protein MNAN1_000153 [Malassezia nana]
MRGSLRAWVVALALASVAFARKAPKGPVYADKDPENYMQEHMAAEHHIGAFDLASFFALHDLDRNGLLERSEIEAIYGVHHSLSRKHSPNAEVHDEKADKIVREVLRRLDTNHDGMVSRAEFLRGGKKGLPQFPEFGRNTLGHHYDEESEYYVHHESLYHSRPEDQTEEAYSHPEDTAHFRQHERIEREEEERERLAEGLPSIEEEQRLKANAQRAGREYESQYDRQYTPENAESAQEYERMSKLGAAGRDLLSAQHTFKTPNGPRQVKATKENVVLAQGEFGESNEPPVFAAGDSAARAPIDHISGETELGRKIRLDQARREASGRPRFGQGASGMGQPRDSADRFKAGMPYKYRMKNNGFLRDL